MSKAERDIERKLPVLKYAEMRGSVAKTGAPSFHTKPRSPRLNGKVERSHQTDNLEFSQLLTDTDDVDLSRKLREWEDYYNFHRPPGALNGRAP